MAHSAASARSSPASYDTTVPVEAFRSRSTRANWLAISGSNGAGKSTTIKMLSGILVPIPAQVTVNGIMPWEATGTERAPDRRGLRAAHAALVGPAAADSLKLIGKLYRVETERDSTAISTA